MNSILALLIIILISFLVVRVGSNALILTGMSSKAAKFQAISAFFGVGFTTAEAEMVMSNDVRRKVIRHLIISGNIGLTSALATLVVTFSQSKEDMVMSKFITIGVVVLAVFSLGLFFNMKIITKPLDALMKKGLEKSGVVRALDYDLLLRLDEGYCVSEVMIAAGHPWADKKLKESRPSDASVVILNIRHADGRFSGAPNKDHIIRVGDEVMVYGDTRSVDTVAHLHLIDLYAREVVDSEVTTSAT
jgi:flagellar biogenesis protein FliO